MGICLEGARRGSRGTGFTIDQIGGTIDMPALTRRQLLVGAKADLPIAERRWRRAKGTVPRTCPGCPMGHKATRNGHPSERLRSKPRLRSLRHFALESETGLTLMRHRE
jgi:hypothetical protein